MADLTLRLVKGSPLTNAEVDNNFSSLNTAKYESGDSATFSDVTLENSAGAMIWNSIDSTVDIPLNADVTLQVGQEQVFYGKAQVAISNGDVVMFAGAQGGHVLFTKADATAQGFRPEWIIGVATQDMAINQFGFVTSLGKVRGLDTTAFTEGSLLWLDPVNPGALTATQPVAPAPCILMAAVISVNANEGVLFVRPTFGKELADLCNVNIEAVADGELLQYNSANGRWENSNQVNLDIETARAEAVAFAIALG